MRWRSFKENHFQNWEAPLFLLPSLVGWARDRSSLVPFPIMNDVITQLNQADKGACRVSFSDSLPKHRSTTFARHRYFDHIHAYCCHCFFACCGWICLAVFGTLLVFFIISVGFMSFLQSGLPEITVRMLDLSDLEIENSTNHNNNNNDNALLNARVEMSIEMKNMNDVMELTYNDIVVNLASEDVRLGESVIKGFFHHPGNTTYLNVTMNVVGDSTDKDGALELEDDKKKVQMDVKVTMEATIGFHLGIFNFNNVPIHVACDFQQSLLKYRVREPPCNIRMFPISLK